MPSPHLPRYDPDRPTVARRNRLIDIRFGRGLAGLGVGLVLGVASLWTPPSIDGWLLGAFTLLAVYNCTRLILTALRLRKIDDVGHITHRDSD